MFVQWRGAGLYTLLFYILTLIAVNVDVLLHYSAARFREINWWVPALLTAAFNWWWVNVARQMKGKYDRSTQLGRLFMVLGERHALFWIPLQYWTIIFLALGLHGLYYAVVR
jgi:hypothetical protein